MMTVEEQRRNIESVRTLSRAMFKKWMDDTWYRLNAYNTLLEPPATIRDANCARVNRLLAESNAARDLYKKLEKIEEKLYAMPTKMTITHYDGKQGVIVCEGMLPDFESTSQDETQALKMLADYYARKTE